MCHFFMVMRRVEYSKATWYDMRRGLKEKGSAAEKSAVSLVLCFLMEAPSEGLSPLINSDLTGV